MEEYSRSKSYESLVSEPEKSSISWAMAEANWENAILAKCGGRREGVAISIDKRDEMFTSQQ